MSPAPHQPPASPARRGSNPVLSDGPAILPPDRHASRSVVHAATRLRALHLDPLLTAGDQPLPRTGTGGPDPLAPGPRLHREAKYFLRTQYSRAQPSPTVVANAAELL